MALTYSPIASQVMSTSTATVSFANIPDVHTDLVLVISARSTASEFNNTDFLNLTFNSDTGTNYSGIVLYTRNSGSWFVGDVLESNKAYYRPGSAPAPSNASSIFGCTRTQIFGYANTNVHKSILTEAGYSSDLTLSDGPYVNVGLWRSTAAISSLSLSLVKGSFASGSRFDLYGIDAA